MEQHPIPRNITGFQFKLIGDMTLRQFGYLATGAIIGYMLFKFMPLPSFVNITIGGLVFFLGFAFAFLPFQDRPIDQWLVAFIKSVYSPTQFVYHKDNTPPDILLSQTATASVKKTSSDQKKQFVDSKKMLEAYLTKLPKKATDYFDQNEKMALSQTLSLFALTSQPSSPTIMVQKTVVKPAQPAPVPQVILEAKKQKVTPPPVHAPPPIKKEEKEKELINETNQARQLSSELEKLRREIKEGAEVKAGDPQLEKRFLELEQKLTSLLTEREKLTQEIAQLRQKENPPGKAVQPKAASEDVQKEPSARIITPKQASNVGILNNPTIPNLILGVVNDQNHMSLSNVLITVKDMRNTPLRALKTNKLGQFYASTPLANGTYVLEIEDPQKRYSFDLIQLKLTGQIVQPLEITAKQREDPVRQRLAKELFQKNFA